MAPTLAWTASARADSTGEPLVVQVINGTRNSVLGHRIRLAQRWWARTFGLLGRVSLESGEGILISPCRGVHTVGMRYPLDIVLLDGHGVVLRLHHAFPPGRSTGLQRRVRHVLELPAGTVSASRTQEGDQIAWLPAREPETERIP